MAEASILWPPDVKRWLIGKDWGWERLSKRKRGWRKMRWVDSISNSIDMNLYKLWEIVEDRGTWNAAVHEVTKSWTRLSDWTKGGCTILYSRQQHIKVIVDFGLLLFLWYVYDGISLSYLILRRPKHIFKIDGAPAYPFIAIHIFKY